MKFYKLVCGSGDVEVALEEPELLSLGVSRSLFLRHSCVEIVLCSMILEQPIKQSVTLHLTRKPG